MELKTEKSYAIDLLGIKREYDRAREENSLMEINSEYAQLVEQIKSNNSKLFNRETCRYYTVPDKWGEDRIYHTDFGCVSVEYKPRVESWKFSEDLYQNCLKRVNEFDKKVLTIKALKDKLDNHKGIGFKEKRATKKQVKILQKELYDNGREIESLKYVQKEEKEFKDTWFKDGKFVDINESLVSQAEKIYNNYQRELVKALYKKYPELKNIDISSFSPFVKEFQDKHGLTNQKVNFVDFMKKNRLLSLAVSEKPDKAPSFSLDSDRYAKSVFELYKLPLQDLINENEIQNAGMGA